MLRTALLALLALALPAWPQVPAVVAERMRAGGLPDDALAFTVQRASDGSVVASHGAGRPMQPASTLKILTSLVALETLGPAFQGSSTLLSAGEIRGGVLHGDLVLRGEADVDLDAAALERMLQMARLRGVREVRGDVVLDRTHFSPARSDVGLAPFDETPEFRYNFIPDALSLNMSLVHLEMASDAREVRAAMSPPLEGVGVATAFMLVDRDCEDWEDGWIIPEVVPAGRGRLLIRLRGEFPRDCAASTDIHVLERDLFAERLIRAMWKRLGGTLRGHVREGAAPAGAKLLARHRSRPLSELLADIDKHSDNPVTRVIYLAVGATSPMGADLPTARRAELEVRAWLARKGIGDGGLVLENGSGLSRLERISPAQLAAVVRAGLASEWAPEFLASLPIAAVDGGLRSRLRDGAAAKRARLKTGTLRNARGLAGVVKDTRDESFIVAAIVNDEAATGDAARPVLDALVEWVASRGFAGTTP